MWEKEKNYYLRSEREREITLTEKWERKRNNYSTLEVREKKYYLRSEREREIILPEKWERKRNNITWEVREKEKWYYLMRSERERKRVWSYVIIVIVSLVRQSVHITVLKSHSSV